MAIRAGLLDQLKHLEVEAYVHDGFFAIKAPTWKINPKQKLENFLEDFEHDEIGALRDFASVPTHAAQPFFTDPEIFDRQALTAPFEPVDTKTLILNPQFKPNISFTYFVGLDLSVRGDSTGVSLCHFDRYKQKVVLDFAIGVHSEFGERIDYSVIRQLIYNLTDRGFNIKQILHDQFQSNDNINMLRQRGYDAQEVKYSESFVGNTTVHELIHTNKLEFYSFCKQWIGEAKELQIVTSGTKTRVDHLKTDGYWNSKDAWDSSVNAIIRCVDDYYQNGDVEERVKSSIDLMDKMKEQQKEDSKDDLSWLY